MIVDLTPAELMAIRRVLKTEIELLQASAHESRDLEFQLSCSLDFAMLGSVVRKIASSLEYA